jgi:pathogenesis-related protein 1
MKLYALDIFLLILAVVLLGICIGGIITYSLNTRPSVTEKKIYQRALSYHPVNDKGQDIQPRNFPPNELTEKEKSIYLNLHNDFRTKNNAVKLEWDDRLADSAQAWADKLYDEDCAIHHPENKEDDEEYLQNGLDGQNLSQFVYEGRKRKNLQVGSIPEAIKLWTDECKLFDPKNPTKHGVGHFTQLIWKDTTKLGCAHRQLERRGKKASIYVCHYNKSGNWLTSDGGYTHYNKNVEKLPVCDG